MPKTTQKTKTTKKLGQIRINKTPEMVEVLDYLKSKFRLLNEVEIIKMLLSDSYAGRSQTNNKSGFLQSLESKKREGMLPQGRSWLIEKGVNPDTVSDEEILDLLYADDKNQE